MAPVTRSMVKATPTPKSKVKAVRNIKAARKVKATPRTTAMAVVTSYKPTPQTWRSAASKFSEYKGNPPVGRTHAEWDLDYNAADTRVRNKFKLPKSDGGLGLSGRDELIDAAKAARADGRVRNEAIEWLKKPGKNGEPSILSADYVDDNI